MGELTVYEYGDANDLLEQFYPDMYNELEHAAYGHYPSNPVWDAVSPMEKLLVQEDDEALANGFNRYVEALDPIEEQCVWIASRDGYNATDVLAGNNTRPNRNIELYVYRDGHKRSVSFLDYVNEYADVFTGASSRGEFVDRMEDTVDDWKTQLAKKHEDWYESVWDAAQTGSPSLTDILKETEEERERLHMQIAVLLPDVRDKALNTKTTTDPAQEDVAAGDWYAS